MDKPNRLNAQIARAASEVRQRWPDWMVEKVEKINMSSSASQATESKHDVVQTNQTKNT